MPTAGAATAYDRFAPTDERNGRDADARVEVPTEGIERRRRVLLSIAAGGQFFLATKLEEEEGD